jgi:hypothetical protein
MAAPLATELDWETANNEFLAASLERLRLLLRSALPGGPVPASAITAAAHAVERAEQAGPVPALVGLAQRLGLSRFERDTLLLCAAIEFDPGIAELCASIQGTPHATFGLALRVLPEQATRSPSPVTPSTLCWLGMARWTWTRPRTARTSIAGATGSACWATTRR